VLDAERFSSFHRQTPKAMPSQSLSSTHLEVIKSIEVAGFPIEVGVLRDGTPFLSGRGLARACGISNSTLVGWGERAPAVGDKYRAGKLANLLATYRYAGDRLFIRLPDEVKFGGRANVSAYPYQVCMAFLDYYAFEANKEDARNSLRILSEKQLPTFIYDAIGYTPQPVKPALKQSDSDRPLRGRVPEDYFSVFQTTSHEKLRFIQNSLSLDPQAVTYINIAKAWSRYWDIQKLWEQYGQRLPYLRKSLDPSPYRTTDGYIKTYIYPIEALSEFNQWLNLQYIPERFPSYLQRKIQQRNSSAASSYQLPQAG